MSNSVINVIYHYDDPDGHVAAMAAAYGISEEDPKASINFFQKQYTDEFDNHELVVDKNDNDVDLVVYYVDLSFTKDTYFKMITPIIDDRRVTKVIWIDHHASSATAVDLVKEELSKIAKDRPNFDFDVVFSTEASGALLTWAYIQLNLMVPEEKYEILDVNQFIDDEGLHCISLKIQEDPVRKFGFEIPDFIYHVDNYDRWTKKDPDADAFITGLKIEGYQIFSKIYLEYPIISGKNFIKDFFDIDDKSIIKAGKIALEYQKQIYLEQSDLIGFDTIGKYKYAYKVSPGNSWNFNDLLDKGKVDFGILIRYDPTSKKWIHIIYANVDKFDQCNKIAETLGGGGHPGASGFQIDYPLPMNMDRALEEYPEFFNFVFGNNN